MDFRRISPHRKTERQFYVLALSKSHVRLFACDMHGFREMELGGAVPEGMSEAMKYTDAEKQSQSHTLSSRPGQSPQGMGHGHGVGRDDEKMRAEEYFREVSAGVADILRGDRSPMVLAAVEYLVPIYRKVNRYAHLLDELIHGSPDRLSGRELHTKAVELMRHQIMKDRF